MHPVAMRGAWDVPSAAALARLYRRLRPDVVHWHAARAHALGALAAKMAPGPALVLSRRVEFPVRGSIGSRLLYSLPIHRIAAISVAVRDALLRSGVDPERIRIVPSGIDLALYSTPFDRAGARARLGMEESEIVALSVAALAPHKGHSELIRAAAHAAALAPALRLWIVGDGPLQGRLSAERDALGLGGVVRFLGFRSDVPDLLRAADLFCTATRSEGLGTSVLEAMASGLAVVAFGIGGIRETVENGRTGVLVGPEDTEGFAGALAALARDAERRCRMGACGKERARAFDADRTAQLTREVYREAMAARAD